MSYSNFGGWRAVPLVRQRNTPGKMLDYLYTTCLSTEGYYPPTEVLYVINHYDQGYGEYLPPRYICWNVITEGMLSPVN